MLRRELAAARIPRKRAQSLSRFRLEHVEAHGLLLSDLRAHLAGLLGKLQHLHEQAGPRPVGAACGAPRSSESPAGRPLALAAHSVRQNAPQALVANLPAERQLINHFAHRLAKGGRPAGADGTIVIADGWPPLSKPGPFYHRAIGDYRSGAKLRSSLRWYPASSVERCDQHSLGRYLYPLAGNGFHWNGGGQMWGGHRSARGNLAVSQIKLKLRK